MNQLKVRLLLFIILILALLPVVRPTWFFRPTEIRQAIQKGLGFYAKPENLSTIRIDDAFLFELVKHAEPSLSPITLPKETLQTYEFDPLKRLINPAYRVPNLRFYRRAYPYQPLSDINNNSYLVNPPYEKYLRDPYDDILFKALYCDLDTYNDGDFAILKSIPTKTGDYADTHFLLGLLILRENRCFDQNRIAAEVAAIVPHITKAAQQDVIFSDLYAERITLLYWAGRGDQIREEWIDRITKAVTDDPGWRDGETESSNAHTTGLALLALIYFEAGQVQQDFYVPNS